MSRPWRSCADATASLRASDTRVGRAGDRDIVVSVEHPKANLEGFQNEKFCILRYRRVEQGPMREAVCAENNAKFFNYDVEPSLNPTSPTSSARSAQAGSVARGMPGTARR
jgi:hypothetical protein